MGQKGSKNQIGKKFEIHKTTPNAFAFDLFSKLSSSQNLVFSPISIITALLMAAIGSSGESQAVFKQLFQYEDAEILVKIVKQQLESLAVNTPGVQALLANKIYSGLPNLRAEYAQLMKAHFDSAIEQVVFQNNPEEIRGQINLWAQQKTSGKVSNLLPANSIDALTRMVLVNAIYFKGNWMHPFDEKETTNFSFNLKYDHKDREVEVPFMRQTKQFDYYQNETFQYIQIPYAGGDYAMEIILPNDIEQFENEISLSHFEECRKNKRDSKVNLLFPKFKIGADEKASTSLKEILCQLGLSHCFSNAADFSFMDPNNSIKISDVFHKAVIEVNEEGTEATGVTGTVMELRCMPEEMHCQSPFIYAITHVPSQSFVFLGKVTDPSKEV